MEYFTYYEEVAELDKKAIDDILELAKKWKEHQTTMPYIQMYGTGTGDFWWYRT